MNPSDTTRIAIYIIQVLGSLSTVACGSKSSAPPQPHQATVAGQNTELPCGAATGGSDEGGDQYIAITVASQDELSQLDLVRLPGLSLPDHQTPDVAKAGRVTIGAYATDQAISTLCARGCTPARGCEVRVVSSKHEEMARWNRVRCQVDRGSGVPPDPTCATTP
jgi:hypothetical protein